ncbi:MAG: peptide transporter [Helicobacter sp.]|nr:peptide transporter [Helicobacter sp.]
MLQSQDARNLFFGFVCIVLLYALFAYTHFLEYQTFLTNPQNFFQNHLILTSYDGYYYAKHTRDFGEILSQDFGIRQIASILEIDIPFLSFLGGILSRFFGLENVLEWSSVALGGTLGIVLFLLLDLFLKHFGILGAERQFLSILGAGLGIFAPAFYQRSIVGYFDTDMLILTLPLLSIYGLCKYLWERKIVGFFIFGIFGVLGGMWHSGIQNLFLCGLICFVIFEGLLRLGYKKQESNFWGIVSVFLIILMPSVLSVFIVIIVIIARIWLKDFFILLTLIAAYGFYASVLGIFNPLIAQINAYFWGEIQHSSGYIYASVVNWILETTPSTSRQIVERLGGITQVSLALLGLGFFMIFASRKQWYLFALLLPFFILGIASYWLGARFNLFLIPILSLGFVMLFAPLFRLIPKSIFRLLLLCGVGILLVWQKPLYAIPQPILSQNEVQSFKQLSVSLKSEDILFSWWDYGYALSYFTPAKVLLNGGRHSGVINYPVAEILLNSNATLAYHLSFLLAYEMEQNPPRQWNGIFENLLKKAHLEPLAFLETLKENHNPQKFQAEILNNLKGEVYWVLPLRTLMLLANINVFRAFNPQNGKAFAPKTFLYDTPKANPSEIYDVYEDFYLFMQIKAQNDLARLEFRGMNFLLSLDYLKSNLVQWLVFKNHALMDIVLDDSEVKAYRLKKD